MKKELFIVKTFLFFICAFSCQNKNKPSESDIHCSTYSSYITEIDNNIVLNLKINDSLDGNFVFDSGCNNIIFDSIFNTEKIMNKGSYIFNNKLQYKFRLTGIPYHYNIDYFEVLNLNSHFNKNVSGVVGISYFYDHAFGINFEEKTFNIITCENLKNKYNNFNVDKIESNRYQISLIANLKVANVNIKGKFIIDTGSQLDLVLSKQTIINYRLDTIKNNVEFTSNSIQLYGDSKGFFIKKNQLNFLNHEFNDLIVFCDLKGNDPISDSSYSSYCGLIGLNILNKFNFVIDPINNVILSKRNNKIIENYKLIGPGFLIKDTRKENNGLEVTGIFVDSDAYKKGIKIGDLIFSINNVKVKQYSINEINSLLKNNSKTIKIKYLQKGKFFDSELKCKVIF